MLSSSNNGREVGCSRGQTLSAVRSKTRLSKDALKSAKCEYIRSLAHLLEIQNGCHSNIVSRIKPKLKRFFSGESIQCGWHVSADVKRDLSADKNVERM